MPNKIYIVAGERNMASWQVHGGLWANVGQTTRNVSNRLQDDDYKRKAGGGEWKILFEQDVSDGFTDHQIHPFLKQHPGVSWVRESNNTEEFLFKGDPGDGSVARQIVDGILRKICLPLLQEESSKLRKEVERLQAELEQAGNTIRDLASGELNNIALMKIKELEGQNDTLSGGIRVAAERIGEIAREMEALRSELKDSRESELMMKRQLKVKDVWHDDIGRAQRVDLAPSFTEPSRMWPAFLIVGLVAGLLGMMVGRNHSSEWEKTFKNHTPTSLLEAKGATEQMLMNLELQYSAREDQLKKVIAESDLDNAEPSIKSKRSSTTSSSSSSTKSTASTASTKTTAPDARTGEGLLTIGSDPRAQVMVNGQYVRYTPVFKHPIAAGTHTVLLVAEDGRRKSFKVTVEPNEETRKIWHFDEDRWDGP